MRALLSLILLAGAMRLPVHRDAPKRPSAKRVQGRSATADAGLDQPARDPNCVCQGRPLSPEQVGLGLHICEGCTAS